MMGVSIKDVEPADVQVFSLPNANGAVVSQVPDGPAKSAGVQLGDVIVGVDGQPIVDRGDLMERIAMRQPGERVNLDLIRYGRRERVAVTLGSFATEAPTRQTSAAPAADAVGRLGFAAEAQAAQGRARGAPAGGVIITRVDPSGPAPRILEGLKIEKLNGRDIRTVDDLSAAARGLTPGDAISVIASSPSGEQTIVNYKVRN
jgi:serine protease Do